MCVSSECTCVEKFMPQDFNKIDCVYSKLLLELLLIDFLLYSLSIGIFASVLQVNFIYNFICHELQAATLKGKRITGKTDKQTYNLLLIMLLSIFAAGKERSLAQGRR